MPVPSLVDVRFRVGQLSCLQNDRTNERLTENDHITSALLWAPAHRKPATMLYFLPMFIYLFFYDRLILRPWWTEVRESFTRGGPWASLKKLLLGFFPGHSSTTGWAKKWRNLAYFKTPPANFLLSRPNAAEYCNSEKKLLSTDGFSTMYATFGKLWLTNPWDPRDTKFLKNDTRE